jgi:D-3-phosphoglycerate dehydrogenase
VIAAATKLRIIVKRGAKPENVDYEAATKKGIVVAWTPGVNYVAVAEHTVMLMLCLAKKTIPQMERLRGGAWREADAGLQELCGKTVGIVGLGGIGRVLCRMVGGFDVKFLAYDPYISPAQAKEVDVNLVGLEDLLRQSDYITLHAALTDETRHLIGEKELSMMKKTAYLINTARGGLIDESALLKALKEGEIAGAGLDVFEPEPPEHENPLLHLPNVVVTPHMAGWSDEAVYREQKEAALEIKLVLEGESPRYPINPEALENKRP